MIWPVTDKTNDQNAAASTVQLAMHMAFYVLLHAFASNKQLQLWIPSCNDRAMAAVLQGQSRVPAAQAQVLFATVPLWAALFAWLALSGESMSTTDWIGGSAILTASFIASNAPKT